MTLSTDPPSKLPVCLAISSKLPNVSSDGSNTNTPELKQSGQPISGAAESSSRSNSSSTFSRTKVSASRKTHFEYWVKRQTWILEKVMPSSGLVSRASRSVSPLSISSTTVSSSQMLDSLSLLQAGGEGWGEGKGGKGGKERELDIPL